MLSFVQFKCLHTLRQKSIVQQGGGRRTRASKIEPAFIYLEIAVLRQVQPQ